MDQAESLRNIIKKQEIDDKNKEIRKEIMISNKYIIDNYGYIRQRWRR